MEFLGKLLGNRYYIEEQLGGGGMALVYRARCNFLNREVTIKILRPQYNDDQAFVERFRREAQAVAKLSHPNIVNVYDTGEQDGLYYIVMEYVEGRNLKEVIKDRQRLDVKEAVSIAKQIGEGLEHAHESGIVHRDIKPHNILVNKMGKVKVTDFGIARANAEVSVTQTGTIVGSVHYLAPEQAKGGAADVRSDLYSVGIVLYEMLTGKLPFEGDTPIAVAMQHIQAEPERPSLLNPQVTKELEQVVLRAIAKDPDQRYQSASELVADLATVLSGTVSEKTMLISPDEFATVVMKTPVTEAKAQSPETGIFGKNTKRIIGALVVLGLLLGVVFAQFSDLFGVQEVKVPDLRNKTDYDARLELEELHLTLKVTGEAYSEEVAEGQIISQQPAAGSMVKPKREIEVVVSKGPQEIEVPDLSGMEQREAEIELQNNLLELGEVTEEYNEEVEAGQIISQSPEAEETANKGDKVDIVISKGKEAKFVNVPQIVGMTKAEAREALGQQGLKLEEPVEEAPSDEYFAGYVITQEPEAGPGVLLEEGSTVKVTISSGPGPAASSVPVDYVVPLAVDEAEVSVKVFDVKEPTGRQLYSEEKSGGEAVNFDVQLYPPGRIEIYLDDDLVVTREVK